MDTMSTSPSPPSTPPTVHDANAARDAAASALSTLASVSASAASSSAGPLKKRRKVVDNVETQGDPDKLASPSGSVENNFSVATTQFPGMLHCLLASGDANDGIRTSTHVDSSTVSSALEWLPHGRGFRVLRWDIMCTEVLPTVFPKLCSGMTPKKTVQDSDEGRDDNTDKESLGYNDEQWIDAFLRKLRVWGFEEVVAGRERGSFRHEVSLSFDANSCMVRLQPKRFPLA